MVKKELSFEAMTKELEEILLTLERGERPLEEMLQLYARGVELTGLCRAKLNAAEEALNTGVPAPEPPDVKSPDDSSEDTGAASADTLF
jgi:exodeoxyribonuclease VII small subunit